MSEETLEAYILQQIEAQKTGEVVFSWQGGEPTLLGLDFYRKAVAFQHRYKGDKKVRNAFQTNAILIDDEWCAFFKENDFLVGVSIDGPAHLHDAHRLYRTGKPSHKKVMEAVERLNKHKVDFNTLTVVSSTNAQQPKQVYEFLKGIGSTYMQFIPLVEKRASESFCDGLTLIHPQSQQTSEVTDWSVSSKDYGHFLTEIFDVWVHRDVGQVFVNMFDSTLATWCGEPAGLCVLSPTCGHAFALEANGDLYNCDHYVYPEYRVGNIHEQSIAEMNNSEAAIQFGLDKRDKLTRQCKACDFRFACHGGCPKHRVNHSNDGEPLHNYFCEGYTHFFRHSAPYMQVMRDLINQQRSPMEIMFLLQQKKQQAKTQAGGRNAPCPCGSGKKFKRCCA